MSRLSPAAFRTNGANGAGALAAPHGAYSAAHPDPAPAGENANAWVDAVRTGRTAFAGAFGDLARGKRNWQIAFFCLLGAFVPAVLGLSAAATQTKITPYVVAVDRHGRPQPIGPAERTTAADQRIVVAALATWVRNVKTVSADPVTQRDMVEGAYGYVDQGAAQYLQSYMTDPAHDPRVLSGGLSRTVDVNSVLPLPGAVGRGGKVAPNTPVTWKVTWTETDYPRGGGQPTSTAWEGYLTTRVQPPTTDDRITVNPLGLYVTSINWTQVGARASESATSPAAPPAPEPAAAAPAAPATPAAAPAAPLPAAALPAVTAPPPATSTGARP